MKKRMQKSCNTVSRRCNSNVYSRRNRKRCIAKGDTNYDVESMEF